MPFTQYDFNEAIIGYDFFRRPIYSFDKMVQHLVVNERFNIDEARAYLETELENTDEIVLYRFY